MNNLRESTAGDRDRQGILFLRSNELAEAISVADVVDAVERAYRLCGRGELSQAPRVAVRHAGEHTFLQVMPAVGSGLAATHIYTGGNRGAPVVQKVTLVFGTDDGGLRAIIESEWLSWARTGSTGAVATRHLATAEASRLGIVGSGRQARAQAVAIAATRPLSGCLVYSPDRDHREAFARELANETGLVVEARASADEVVAASDIVSTATTSRSPVFSFDSVRPGLHINAIGAHYPDRREIDEATVSRSRVFVDDLDRSRGEDGELRLATREGELPGVDAIGLADVVAGVSPGRSNGDDVTLFLSGGLASEYLTVASLAIERAEALGLGTRIGL